MPLSEGIFSIIYHLNDLDDIAGKIISHLNQMKIILLYGDLGAGKTTLTKSLIRHLLPDNDFNVCSPTFNIVNIYSSYEVNVAHFDCYRLKSAEELHEIGIEELLTNNICIIEWPEIVEKNFLKHLSYFKVMLDETHEIDRREISIIKISS